MIKRKEPTKANLASDFDFLRSLDRNRRERNPVTSELDNGFSDAMLALPTGGVYDFDLNDFGLQPEIEKEDLSGKVVFVHGVSNATFQSEDYDQPAKSLLWNWPTDDDATNPNGWHWGLMLSVDSPAIKQVQQMVERGRTPFVAKLVKKESERHKNQTYWTLERYVMQYDSDGRLVDPNEAVIGRKAK